MGILQAVKDSIHESDVHLGSLEMVTLEFKLIEHSCSVEKIIEKVFEKKRLKDKNLQVESILKDHVNIIAKKIEKQFQNDFKP